MSIDLIRVNILEFAYPTEKQLKKWRKEQEIRRNKLLGVKIV